MKFVGSPMIVSMMKNKEFFVPIGHNLDRNKTCTIKGQRQCCDKGLKFVIQFQRPFPTRVSSHLRSQNPYSTHHPFLWRA